ncbi:MAG: hypothetical protein ACXAC5_04360 [Promethearchaeota archaeon]
MTMNPPPLPPGNRTSSGRRMAPSKKKVVVENPHDDNPEQGSIPGWLIFLIVVASMVGAGILAITGIETTDEYHFKVCVNGEERTIINESEVKWMFPGIECVSIPTVIQAHDNILGGIYVKATVKIPIANRDKITKDIKTEGLIQRYISTAIELSGDEKVILSCMQRKRVKKFTMRRVKKKFTECYKDILTRLLQSEYGLILTDLTII